MLSRKLPRRESGKISRNPRKKGSLQDFCALLAKFNGAYMGKSSGLKKSSSSRSVKLKLSSKGTHKLSFKRSTSH